MEKKNSSRKSTSTTKLLLSQVIDFLPDPTFAIDLKGKVLVWNRAMEDMTGVKAEDMVGKGMYEYSLPFYNERRPILIDLITHPDPDMDNKYTFVRREGDTLYAEAVGLASNRFLWGKASPIYDKTGQIIGAIESIRDITDRKEIEKAHTEALLQLTQFIDFLPDPTFAIDLKGRVIIWNKAIEDLTNIPSEYMVGKADYEHALPFYGIRRPMLVDNILDPAIEIRENYSYLKKVNDVVLAIGEVEINNRKITLWGKASPIYDSQGNILGAIESVRDITEAKQTEEALRQSEARYKDIFFNVSDLLYIQDLKGNFIETNLASKKTTGYTDTDMKNLNIKDILPKRFKNQFKNYINRLLENGYDEGLMTITTKTGDERIMEYRNSIIIDHQGRPAGIRGSARDITSRISASKQLKKERALTASIVETSPAFYDAVNPQGKVLFMSQAMLGALGYSLPEVVGKDYLESFIPEEDRADCKDAMDRMISSRSPIVHENRVLTKDGRNLLVQWQGKAVFRENGELEFVFGIGIDVTDQRLLNDAMHESEEKYRKIFENASEGIFQTTPQGRYLSVNPAFARMFGFSSPQEMIEGVRDIGKELYVNPKDRDNLVKMLREQGNVEGFEAELYRTDKSTFWISINVHTVYDEQGNILYFEGTNIDISPRKQMDKALKESEEKYRAIFENANEGLYQTTPEGRLLNVNPALARMFGFTSPSEMIEKVKDIGKDLYVNPKDRETMLRMLREQGVVEGFEVEMRRQDKSTFWISISLHTIHDSAGKIAYLEGTNMDITGRRRSEEALRESEERFRRMAEASPEIFWMINPDYSKVIYVSPAMERITGIAPEELYRNPRTWIDLVHPEDRGFVSSMFDSKQKEDVEYEFRLIHRDSTVRWILNRCYFVRDTQGNIIYLTGIAEDITERKHAEEERKTYEARLMRSQKLEAIGTLAGGIAHDFNNILSAIIGYSELAIDELPKDSTIATNIKEVLKAGGRARDLVKQILTFSRQMETERKPVRIHLIIKEALKLLRSSIPSTITITEHIDTSAGTVFADSTQIHQVIMNLCTNAYQALLTTGGELTVSLEQLYLDSGFISKHPPLSKGAHLLITVRDTGCGMDTETLKRIFDPFFTTKEKTKGTGLGLATVHGIVTELGGAILVESSINKGSTFEIYLPVSLQEHEDLDDLNDESTPGTGESILLVDDEEAIVNFTQSMLGQLGYKVKGLCSSIDALTHFRSAPDEIDLVITDQTMPGITGSQLATEILKIRPDVPIILMTGYSETITPEEAVAKGIKEYLDKPFTKNMLAGAIGRSLKD
jgi:PAS domain S-box-containing protein